MTTAKTKCLCFVSRPALTHPFLGVEGGKDPGAEVRPCCPAWRCQGGDEGWAQYTARSEEKFPPLPISIADSVLRHQPCPRRQTRCCPPLPLHVRWMNTVGRMGRSVPGCTAVVGKGCSWGLVPYWRWHCLKDHFFSILNTCKKKKRGLHKYLLYVLGGGRYYFFFIFFFFLFFFYYLRPTLKTNGKTKKRLKPMENNTKPTLEVLNSLPEACDQQVAIGVWLFISWYFLVVLVSILGGGGVGKWLSINIMQKKKSSFL